MLAERSGASRSPAARACSTRVRRDRSRLAILAAAGGHRGPTSANRRRSPAADAQARMLGEAWERGRGKTSRCRGFRLVVHHRSGRHGNLPRRRARADARLLATVDLIHKRVARRRTKTPGPHIHHHDAVPAALTQMAQGTKLQRDRSRGRAAGAIELGRHDRPSDELKTVHRPHPRLHQAARHDSEPAPSTSPRC